MPRPIRETPWIARRGDSGPFYVNWYDPAKRRTERVSLRTEDPREASNRFAAFLTSGAAMFDKSTSPTVDVVIDHYLREHIRPNAVAVKRAEAMPFPTLRFVAVAQKLDFPDLRRLRVQIVLLSPLPKWTGPHRQIHPPPYPITFWQPKPPPDHPGLLRREQIRPHPHQTP